VGHRNIKGLHTRQNTQYLVFGS